MAKDVITEALKRVPSEREAFVRERCPDDTLRQEIDALLKQYEEAPEFLESLARLEEPDELADLQPGSRVGPYMILERLGRGGMGEVFLGSDTRLRRRVALKCLILSRLTSEDRRRRILNEARAAARINHPNVATVHDVLDHESRAFIVMEYVEGESLASRLKRERLPIDRVIRMGRQLAAALAAAHATGIIHRDLKPANIQVTADGTVKVLDFGVARALSVGTTAADATTAAGHRRVPVPQVGTPGYISPEQLLCRDVDDRSDIFSLGVILYEMTTGKRPFPSDDIVDLVVMLAKRPTRADAEDSRVPPALADIIARALEIDAADRFQSASELGAALERVNVERTSAPDTANRSTPVDGTSQSVLNGQPGPARFPTAVPLRRRMSPILVATALVIAVGAVAALILAFGAWRGAPSAVPSAAALRSVVVLPLRNASGDPAQDYFVDGMTELLTADLSGVSALRVIADSAARIYRGTTKSASEIARELHVDAVVEGSVVRSGDQVRVTVQLVHAGTNLSLWGDSFEREANNAFQLQADIARRLVSEVRAVLTTGERRKLAQAYTANPEAQDLYLRARYWMHTQNRDRLQDARALLERAVQIDPGYAVAWSSLSRCYVLLQDFGVLSPSESRRLGIAAARAALDRDETMFEAHAAMADALFKLDWNWDEADRHYRQALDANPSFVFGRAQYARFLAAAGRVDQAVDESRRAEESDPLSSDVKMTLAMMLFYQRRYSDAVSKADEALKLNQTQPGPHVVRGRALAALGRLDDAAAEMQNAVRLSGASMMLAELGRLYAAMGRPTEAEAILDRLLKLSESHADVNPAEDAAYVQLELGRRDEAMANLERSVDERSERILWLRVDPRVDTVRDDPRFRRLIARIGGLAESH
jgi:serine/threonine protein kinase/TolB-like protein/Flp pilus assembly protein TadD